MFTCEGDESCRITNHNSNKTTVVTQPSPAGLGVGKKRSSTRCALQGGWRGSSGTWAGAGKAEEQITAGSAFTVTKSTLEKPEPTKGSSEVSSPWPQPSCPGKASTAKGQRPGHGPRPAPFGEDRELAVGSGGGWGCADVLASLADIPP